MEKEMKYYLFELGYTVVKSDGRHWYERDPDLHIWKEDSDWMRRFIDAQYDVIEIDYDEDHERILARRQIPGCWSSTLDKLLYPDRKDESGTVTEEVRKDELSPDRKNESKRDQKTLRDKKLYPDRKDESGMIWII